MQPSKHEGKTATHIYEGSRALTSRTIYKIGLNTFQYYFFIEKSFTRRD